MMPDEAETTAAPAAATEPSGGGIKSAAEVIEKVLAMPDNPAVAAAAPAPTAKDAKDKPAKGEPPPRRVEKLEAKSLEKPATEAPAEPDTDASALAKARFHLQHGDVGKAIEAAFGELKSEGLPDAVREALARKLGVGSAQWEKIRRYEQGAKRAVAAREAELGGIVDRLKAEFAPFHEARRLYKAGDYDAAFKAAFEEDPADYQRKLISQRVGKNPEVEKLRAELEQERADRVKREQQAEEARAQAEQTQAQHTYMTEMQGALLKSADPEIASYAKQPAFIQRCFAVLQRVYQTKGVEADLGEVVDYVRTNNVSVAEARAWAPAVATGLEPAKAVQASAPPAKSPVAKAPARVLTQSRAAEGTAKPRKMTSAEVREYHQRLMEQNPAAE